MPLLDASVLGLPLHPLVVHVVVVLLPLGAAALIAIIVVPSWRTRYGVLALGTLTVGALASVVARITGLALAETETLPRTHAQWGNILVPVALVVAALGWVWWFLERRREKAPAGSSPLGTIIASAVSLAGALAVIVLTVLTGHSGAQATWGTSGVASPSAGVSTPASPGATAEATPTASGYTLEEVAEHDTAESCWAAINGEVYDLTEWIGVHPGGASHILALCGTDATERFELQHSDDRRPNTQLERFRIGALV